MNRVGTGSYVNWVGTGSYVNWVGTGSYLREGSGRRGVIRVCTAVTGLGR